MDCSPISKIRPKAKRLTLDQAIEATRKPSIRFGELICVQTDRRFGNLYAGMTDLAGGSFASSEIRAIFWPSLDMTVATFAQPATENLLQELYKNGGRVESLAHFSNEALAMFYEYKAGIMNKGGFAGSAGDSRQFERDCADVLDMLPNITQEVAAAVRLSVLTTHKKYKLAAAHGENFTGKKKGAVGPIRKAIAKALKEHPAIKSPEIWDKLKDKPPRGWAFYDNRQGKYIEGPHASQGMEYRRFCNICSEERKKLAT